MIRVLEYSGDTHNIERVREKLDQLHFQAKAQAEIERSKAIQKTLASLPDDEGIHKHIHAHDLHVYTLYRKP